MYIVKEREAGADLRARQACYITYMLYMAYKGICYLCYIYHVVL